MARTSGAGKSIQWGRESTYGTAVTPTEIMNVGSESFKRAVSIDDEGGIAANIGPTAKYTSKVEVSGSAPLILKPENAGLLLEMMTGDTTPSSTTVATGTHKVVKAYTYTPVDPDEDVGSLTIIVDRGAEIVAYSGCKVSKVDFSASEGKPIEASMEIMGRAEEVGILATGLVPSSMKAYQFRKSSISFKGSVVGDVYSVKASYSNGLIAGKNTLGGDIYPQEPLLGERSLDLDIECALPSDLATKKDELLNNTSFSANLKFISPEIIDTVTETTYYEQIEFVIPALMLTNVEANIGGKDEIVCKLSGSAVTSGSAWITIKRQAGEALPG